MQYVAVADARPTFYGRREIALIDAGLPYLDRIWSDRHWTLYAVRDAVPIVQAPGVLVHEDARSVELTAPPNSTVELHLRWFRWLSLAAGGGSGACLMADHGLVRLSTGTGGRYVVSSALIPQRPVGCS